jgi:hypothetical protein
MTKDQLLSGVTRLFSSRRLPAKSSHIVPGGPVPAVRHHACASWCSVDSFGFRTVRDDGAPPGSGPQVCRYPDGRLRIGSDVGDRPMSRGS